MTEQEIRRLPYFRFVQDVFGVAHIQDERNVFIKAFRRHETEASLSFDVARGVCYDFGDGGGEKTCEQILSTLFDVSNNDAKIEIEAMLQGWQYLRPVTPEVVDEYTKNVNPDALVDGRTKNAAKKRLDELLTDRALSPEVVAKYQIGFAPRVYPEPKGRYTIPIFNLYGQVVDIKYHMTQAKGYAKSRHHYVSRGIGTISDQTQREMAVKCGDKVRGYGVSRLYPIDQIQAAANDEGGKFPHTLLLVEGEFDALACISHGHHAVSFTGGAGSWKNAIDRYLPMLWNAGVKLVLLFDSDVTGQAEQYKLAQHIDAWIKRKEGKP